MKTGKADIKINGKVYTITGEGSQAYLEKLAATVDKKVTELLKGDPMMPIDLASILAAINVADDYFKARSETAEQKKKTSLCMDELTEAKTEINNLKIENEMLKLKLEKMKKNEKN